MKSVWFLAKSDSEKVVSPQADVQTATIMITAAHIQDKDR